MTTQIHEPYIIDDESGLLPTMMNHHPAANGFLDMPVFENKPQDLNYDYSKAATGTDIPQYNNPQFDTAQYMTEQLHMAAGLPNTNDIPALSDEHFDTPDSNFSQQPMTDFSSFADTANVNIIPEVTAFSPAQGPAGHKMMVHIQASQELENGSQFPTVLFGGRRCSGVIARTAIPGSYALTVEVPAHATTGVPSAQVPLYLDANDLTGSNLPVAFGQFTFTDNTTSSYHISTSSPVHNTNKRAMTPDQADSSPRNNKRLKTQNLQTNYSNPTSSPLSANVNLSPFSQTQQIADFGYSHTPSRPQTYNGSTPRYNNGVSPQLATSHLTMQPSIVDFTGVNGYIQDRPGVSTSIIGQPSINTAVGSAPALVRTSTLSSDLTSPHLSASAFSPYSSYSSTSKAVLKLGGDLNTMAEDWTSDEHTTHRRLVRFRRSQTGGTINATFEPVTLEDHARAPGNIYVNCIWWKEKGACYITSVDTIQLLESLVAVRFTVEEKNRIRRNLEGFRPATVSKTRPDCEEFFKIIMGFPSPKPRNIEKDVKVFPWKILGHALKKIIGKYSASYGSAPPMPTALIIPSSASSGSIGPGNLTSSPQSASTTSTTSLPFSNDLLAQSHAIMPMQGQYMPVNMSQGLQFSNPTSNYSAGDLQVGRGSFDFSSLFDAGPGSAGPGQLKYDRMPSLSQFGFGMPAGLDFSTQRSTQI